MQISKILRELGKNTMLNIVYTLKDRLVETTKQNGTKFIPGHTMVNLLLSMIFVSTYPGINDIDQSE